MMVLSCSASLSISVGWPVHTYFVQDVLSSACLGKLTLYQYTCVALWFPGVNILLPYTGFGHQVQSQIVHQRVHCWYLLIHRVSC